MGIILPDGFSLGKSKNGWPTIKINVPNIIKTLGGRKWLKERALHLPQSVAEKISPAVQEAARQNAIKNGHTVPETIDYIRGYEQTMADMIYDGVMVTF